MGSVAIGPFKALVPQEDVIVYGYECIMIAFVGNESRNEAYKRYFRGTVLVREMDVVLMICSVLLMMFCYEILIQQAIASLQSFPPARSVQKRESACVPASIPIADRRRKEQKDADV